MATDSGVGSGGCELFYHGDELFIPSGGGKIWRAPGIVVVSVAGMAASSWHATTAFNWHASWCHGRLHHLQGEEMSRAEG